MLSRDRIWMNRIATLLVLVSLSVTSVAEPWAPVGDRQLRHELQLLSDARIIELSTMTWPMSWGQIDYALRAVDTDRLLRLPSLVPVYERMVARAARETRYGIWQGGGRLSLSEKPDSLRGFRELPRENLETVLYGEKTGRNAAAKLQLTMVDNAADDRSARLDGSYVGVALGNWLYSVDAMERWWGPGWDGSLILSNNARPVPALSVQRNISKPFDWWALNWLGPWHLQFMAGQLDSDRFIDSPYLLGWRFTSKPLQSLELGVTRTAQWGGEGRPQDLDSFFDLLIGRGNTGDDNITVENEPGNQLAGFDLRWSQPIGQQTLAAYSQWIGEDEAGGFPSRYLGMGGVEYAGVWQQNQYRLHFEFADTACEFNKGEPRFDCAYNNFIYKTGYRYRDRAIGHTADNDAQVATIGALLINAKNHQWDLLLRRARLNRVGDDTRNTVAEQPQTWHSVDIVHARPLIGDWTVEIGVGYEDRESETKSATGDDWRGYINLRAGL
ncbi:MAG: capsule assembly Wzi family protein [Gammaproteobacteria bacterium]|nr:capsule assembly Wzi family protein [Gammaproteobacteria bacterium]